MMIMKFEIDNKLYDVIIVRKNNKNTYIRVKDNLDIYVTCNILIYEHEINHFLNYIEFCIKIMLMLLLFKI